MPQIPCRQLQESARAGSIQLTSANDSTETNSWHFLAPQESKSTVFNLQAIPLSLT
jgi:hypothetical protein